MTDDIKTIREDLAFMKGLAADSGRMPGVIGAHMLAAGLIFGLPVFPAWASVNGMIELPLNMDSWIWAVSTVVYIPTVFLISHLGPKAPGPGSATGRAFAAGWSAMGITSITIVFAILMASVRLGDKQLWEVWVAICFALYGAAWWAVGMLRGRAWLWVAAGSYLQVVVNAFLIGTGHVLLGCAIGILLWLAGPGLVILIRSRGRLD